LFAFLPFYLPLISLDLRFLRILRIFRVLRVLKLERYFSALKIVVKVIKDKSSELISTFIVILILLIIVASLMYYIEPQTFNNTPQAMWWGIVTLTTVGYGDIYPTTVLGKFVGAILALLGIGLFGLPAGILAAGFIEEIQIKVKEKKKKTYLKDYCKNRKYIIKNFLMKEGIGMKKFVLVFLVFCLVFVLFGCLDMETTWVIRKDNSVIIETTLIPELGSEQDMATYFEAFKIGFAPLFKKFTYKKTTITQNYLDYDAYEFKMKESITISELRSLGTNIKFNGSEFELEIPKIIEEEPYTPDDVVITLIIKFPWSVNVANSTMIEGNTVTWKITEQMLYTGTVLKAYLK
jgi:hypothetical protein